MIWSSDEKMAPRDTITSSARASAVSAGVMRRRAVMRSLRLAGSFALSSAPAATSGAQAASGTIATPAAPASASELCAPSTSRISRVIRDPGRVCCSASMMFRARASTSRLRSVLVSLMTTWDMV